MAMTPLWCPLRVDLGDMTIWRSQMLMSGDSSSSDAAAMCMGSFGCQAMDRGLKLLCSLSEKEKVGLFSLKSQMTVVPFCDEAARMWRCFGWKATAVIAPELVG
jgi:hypothetical protein